jgi:hypothetical protein
MQSAPIPTRLDAFFLISRKQRFIAGKHRAAKNAKTKCRLMVV